MEQELIQHYMETVRMYQQNMATIFRTMGPLLRSSRIPRQSDHENVNVNINNNSQLSPVRIEEVEQPQQPPQDRPVVTVHNTNNASDSNINNNNNNNNISNMGRNLLNTILSPLNNTINNTTRSSRNNDTNNRIPGMFSYYSNSVSNNPQYVNNIGSYRRRYNIAPFDFFRNRQSFGLNSTRHRRLTTEMFDNLTEELVYSDLSTNYDVCPIDLVPFDASENVVRIRHCGHIFRGPNIRRWLQTNYVCPVCRCNLINVYNQMNIENQPEMNEVDNQTNDSEMNNTEMNNTETNNTEMNEEILDNELNNLIEEERNNENGRNENVDNSETKEEENDETNDETNNIFDRSLEETLVNTFNNAIQTTLNDVSLNADLNIQYLFFNPNDQLNSTNSNDE